MKRITTRVAVLFASAAMLITPAVGAQEPEPNEVCKDRSKTYAKFLQPASGQATVNAGPAGSIVLDTGAAAPSVTLSLTGAMDVKIEYGCLRQMGLLVTKDDPQGGPATVVHTAAWELACEQSTKTESVNIGLDGGTYHFSLSGASCTGIGFKNTPEGGLVGDPPLV